MKKTTVLFTVMLIALICFEIFNYDTTRYALEQFFNGRVFSGMTWSTWLGIAAVAADLAGLAGILTPEKGLKEEKGVIAALVGWLLAASLNASLTWYAVFTVMSKGRLAEMDGIISTEQLMTYVPLGLAAFVWLIRVSLVMAVLQAGEVVFHAIKPKPKLTKPKITPRKRPVRKEPNFFPPEPTPNFNKPIFP